MKTAKIKHLAHTILRSTAAVALLGASLVPSAQGATEAFLEEILVTATKKAGGVDVQDASVAITAYGAEQLDALFVRDLKSLSYSAPSVQLEDIGTTRGTANFSIRGMGVNSSIPSIDPTVGVFVDGVYMGVNFGIVMDTFDLEGVEILRGPQGLLFGRNVTGGAVLLRTTRPGDEFHMNTKLAAETGMNYYASTVLSGPLTDTIGGKFAVYYNDDRGYFDNKFDGNDHFGDADTRVLRGALTYTPSETLDFILRYEYGESQGDGPAAQNAALFGQHKNFDFSINFDGYYDNRWNQAIFETTKDVAFGDGQIVNIFGWREYESGSGGDIDSNPNALFGFHSNAQLLQEQWSNELRYSGTFGRVSVTTGVYYFTQDIDYREQRLIFGGLSNRIGGGEQEGDTWAVFTQFDIALNDQWTLNLGGRYSEEDKKARVANITDLSRLGPNQCTISSGCAAYDFKDSDDWTSFSPKIGLEWRPDDVTMVYGFWTKGFRSGGYNLRHTAPVIPNAGFDQEEQDSYEIGLKKDFFDGRMRINAAAYYNEIDDMQRELNLPDPQAGVVQLIRNTAEATITGAELEMQTFPMENLMVQLSAGYVDGTYDKVAFDISSDGVIDAKDKALDLPRLSPWTYGSRVVYDLPVGDLGTITASASFYHRDEAAYTDNNLGMLTAADMVDASIALRTMDDKLTISLYGKNLKDEVTIGGDTQLPQTTPVDFLLFGGPGASFSPLNKGKIIGLEVQYSF